MHNQLNIHILMIYIKHIDYIIIYLPYEHYLFENRMKNLFIKIKMSHFFITFCDPCYSLFIAILKSQMTQFSYTYTDQFRIMRTLVLSRTRETPWLSHHFELTSSFIVKHY